MWILFRWSNLKDFLRKLLWASSSILLLLTLGYQQNSLKCHMTEAQSLSSKYCLTRLVDIRKVLRRTDGAQNVLGFQQIDQVCLDLWCTESSLVHTWGKKEMVIEVDQSNVEDKRISVNGNISYCTEMIRIWNIFCHKGLLNCNEKHREPRPKAPDFKEIPMQKILPSRRRNKRLKKTKSKGWKTTSKPLPFNLQTSAAQ